MIRMRENHDKLSICTSCGAKYQETAFLFDYSLLNEIYEVKFTLCRACTDMLFTKVLKMTCKFNGKVKTKEDMQRITNESILKEKERT